MVRTWLKLSKQGLKDFFDDLEGLDIQGMYLGMAVHLQSDAWR
jgi:hypothetical protein